MTDTGTATTHPDAEAAAQANPRAGYQGQPGSFGMRAASRCGRPVAYPSFERVLRALASREVERIVLPAVNRVAGPIVEPLDVLARLLAEGGTRLAVTAEIRVPVRLVLAAPVGVPLEVVREVLSQPPALRQCRDLLARLDAVPIDAHDTAWAAVRVAELGGPRAAVCSEEAALAAGLVILLEDVSDVRPNDTRFWRLERSDAAGRPLEPTRDEVDPELGLLPPEPPHVLHWSGPRAGAALADLGCELLALPGIPDRPVRGFAVVPDQEWANAGGKLGAFAADIVWLGPSPESKRAPRMKDLPKATGHREPTVVRVGGFVVGGGHRAVIAGPCSVESPEQVMRLAKAVARAGATALRGGVFKPRTSPYAF